MDLDAFFTRAARVLTWVIVAFVAVVVVPILIYLVVTGQLMH